MSGEAGGDATQEAGLPGRLFGGVSREAAEEAIAAAERRAAELATEVEQLRARLSAQEEELDRLRGQEAAVTAALIDAQASADRLRARSERMAQARLREARTTVRELRQYAQDIVLDLLRHVKDATETLDRLSKASDELPVDETATAAWTPAVEDAPAPAAPEPAPPEAAPPEAAPPEAAPPEAAPPEAPPEPPPDEPIPPEPPRAEPAPPAVPPFEPVPREVASSEPAPAEPAPPAQGGPPAGQLEVHVEPVRSAERAIAFERRLLELDGVRNVRLHTFADGAATFAIEISGDGPDLLPLMEERVQILAVSGDRIELRLPSEDA